MKTSVQRSEGEAGVNNQLSVDYDYLWTIPPSLWTFRQKRNASCILTVGTGPRLDEEMRHFFLRTTPLCILPDYLPLRIMYTFSHGLCLPSEKLLEVS